MQARASLFRLDKQRQSNKYLFSTLIKCKECGWSFRRIARTYKNTYVRWVCSGHNGQGAAVACPNAVTVDEDELIDVAARILCSSVLQAKKTGHPLMWSESSSGSTKPKMTTCITKRS